MRKLSLSLLLSGFALVLAAPTLAQEPPHGHRGHPPHGWYDRDHWHRGSWVNGWHAGRLGWWWVVDGVWFFYPAPVYPIPEPPAVVVEPVPQVQPGYYYYCPNPPGYYPAVPQCLMGWQLVPAAPMPVPAPAPQPVPPPQAPAPNPYAPPPPR